MQAELQTQIPGLDRVISDYSVVSTEWNYNILHLTAVDIRIRICIGLLDPRIERICRGREYPITVIRSGRLRHGTAYFCVGRLYRTECGGYSEPCREVHRRPELDRWC